MMKIPKQAYTTEFKELSVKRVKTGQSISAVAEAMLNFYQNLRGTFAEDAPFL